MEDIIIRTKDVYTMEAKISKKIKEIGLVSTDISAVIDDCRALAIAICVGNTTLVCGAFEYLSGGVWFFDPDNTSEKWRELYGWVMEQFNEE